MQKSGKILAAICVVAGVSALPASAQTVHRLATSSGLVAVGSSSNFEVLTQAGSGKVDYFCAAGEFAKRWLNARNSDRLVVTGVRDRSQYRANRLAVAFELNAPAGQGEDFLHVGGPRVGQSISVGHSAALCGRARINTVLDD
ncbi:hypothetical protein [Aliiruegeria lutimaris]|uniref:Uncharacterized protein n=1 Tax=Aliiruegeria lutimaris TaxID=571298 RepID=A0A1G9AU60_9RHOB|nr:hypothetical protein [Aliiruegeria lutimaris]SDK30821.1 hypothetical protein SAMN04488026_103712 [Aliiruegeria lutimaris]